MDRGRQSGEWGEAVRISMALFASFVGLFVSVLRVRESVRSTQQPARSLESQILAVDVAITNMRTLEQFLDRVKTDMLATKAAKDRIEDELRQAKEMEKLTEPQIEALTARLRHRETKDVIMDTVSGFVIGVCSSLLAAFIYTFARKRWRSGERPHWRPKG